MTNAGYQNQGASADQVIGAIMAAIIIGAGIAAAAALLSGSDEG